MERLALRIGRRRRLGQHQLINHCILRMMVEAAELFPDDVVFEVGAGVGNLTHMLCERAGLVISTEVDRDFYEVAKSNLISFSNLVINFS